MENSVLSFFQINPAKILYTIEYRLDLRSLKLIYSDNLMNLKKVLKTQKTTSKRSRLS